MTDEQQKSLLKELLAIREGMATRADLLKLEEGLTGIIIKLAESAGSATQTEYVAPDFEDPRPRLGFPTPRSVPSRTTAPPAQGYTSTPANRSR